MSVTYTTAREMLDPLSEARNRTHILMDTSRILNNSEPQGILLLGEPTASYHDISLPQF